MPKHITFCQDTRPMLRCFDGGRTCSCYEMGHIGVLFSVTLFPSDFTFTNSLFELFTQAARLGSCYPPVMFFCEPYHPDALTFIRVSELPPPSPNWCDALPTPNTVGDISPVTHFLDSQKRKPGDEQIMMDLEEMA